MSKEKTKQLAEAYLLPPESVQDILTRDRHFDVLNTVGPDEEHFMIPIRAEFSSLELMTQKTYRLGMLEICPQVNRDWRLSTYGIKGLKIYSQKKKKSWRINLPDSIFISDMTWSPDGKRIAFLTHLPEGSQVWVADVATGKAEAWSQAWVMATLTGQRTRRSSPVSPSRMLQWTPEGSIITLIVPPDRGPEPEKNPTPSSPIIRHTRDKATPTRTYPFLLRTQHDVELFRYYTKSQMALISSDKSLQMIGKPAMYMSISLSPDGEYILIEKLEEPFSRIIGFDRFPRELQVMGREGQILSTIRKTPLQEAIERDSDDRITDDLPRDVTWRPDGKGLSFLWKESKSHDSERESNDDRKDRLMTLGPPFDMEQAKILATSTKDFSDISYTTNGHYVFTRVEERYNNDRNTKSLAAYDLSQSPPRKYLLVKDIDTKDPTKLPGDILTKTSGNGVVYSINSEDGRYVYLQGPGYKETFKPQPFIDRIEITTGKKERIFEGSNQRFERPLVPLGKDMESIIISRESKSLFPDSYLWKRDGSVTKLTNNKNPFPEFISSQRVDFDFTRRDGLKIQGRISLPPDYKAGMRLPAVFWTYPREYETFKEYQRAAIRRRNHSSFPQLNYRNASDIWLSQGYAVVEPDIPIIGEDDTFNNNYITHLRDSMYAAIRKVDEMGYVDVDRLGHGGHSYGAFATANILANSPFFKAGIGGDGAFNRTLTPMTFQNEERFLWEAEDVYLEMSPFFQADHIDTPLLLYHGAKDDNSGTFLIQSERLIQALTGLGKNAVLYIYPFESHGPLCLETYMDLWTRWLEWFDTHVKNPGL